MDNKDKVLNQIFENPTYSFHIRELARITKLNPNTIINITLNLKKENIIIKRKNKNLVEIKANIEDKKFIRKKRIFNLKQLYNSGLVDFLIEFYNEPESIVVIGSYSRGEDIERSDIDIVIITNKRENPEIKIFGKKLKRKMHILAMKREDISQEFFKNLINGIVLHGYLK
tara:strand:+ start:631 stop:1143 length:513 start_codon:yes stop_codon:yes gene_type:complete